MFTKTIKRVDRGRTLESYLDYRW